ncbi:CCA tRNA nucleotidyltransferase [Ectobacillus funiculus]|uniref:CCA-adding enzyme n=1 Tax=Ectobacillus funiculus TaxID=137993 RepID=A0ABV5WB55_9BACI
MQPFKHAAAIIEKLEKHGFEAYFVGGSVRDFIIGKPISDVDIATSALPNEVMRIFPHHVPIGLEHGTVLVLYEGISYEVTTFRMEAEYDDFRRPSHVSFVRSLEEDLKRRDFTMNAIAMTANGDMIDSFGGQEAIHRKQIQTVGNPDERFREDALRMMRGVRFVSTLGFHLSDETKQAIQEHAGLLVHIAIERIAVEFEKLLLGEGVRQALLLLAETDLYAYLPYFEKKGEQIASAAMYNWDVIQSSEEAWALLLRAVKPENADALLKNWKLSNKKVHTITSILHCLVQLEKSEWNDMLLYQSGEEISIMTERVVSALQGERPSIEHVHSLYKKLPIHSRKDLAVTGTDLLQWTGKQGGPWLAAALGQLEREVVCGRLANSKESVKEWLKQCNLL